MVLLLVFLFVVVPIAELYVLIQVGREIGVLPTIALLILASFLGVVLLRSQGRAAWRRFTQALADGRIPGHEVIDGALVILGGTLLLAPGFLSDGVGLLLLLPPTRVLVRRLIVYSFAGRILAATSGGPRSRAGRILMFGPSLRARDGAAGPGPGSASGSGSSQPSPADDGDVLEGTAREIPPRPRDVP